MSANRNEMNTARVRIAASFVPSNLALNTEFARSLFMSLGTPNGVGSLLKLWFISHGGSSPPPALKSMTNIADEHC